MKKTILTLILAALLLLTTCALAETTGGPEAYLGQPMPDFTVTTISGETFTLSEAVAQHKAVLINLWATWCGPCAMEFPYLEEAYERYQDDVEVIALSIEPKDTVEMLSAYAESHGLTFPVANDAEAGMVGLFVTEGIPTSVLVDRFGNVVLIEVGAQPDVDPFVNAFELLTSDSYTETRILDGFPQTMPIQAGAEGQLAAAVGMPFYIATSEDPYAWPFVPGEKDGRSCIASSNAGVSGSMAEVFVRAEAQAGDAFRFSYRLSTETAYDRFFIERNGEPVKSFSGETDWTTFVLPLDEGENVVRLSYLKDPLENSGDDTVYLTDFALLSGDAAAAAMAENPLIGYPYAEETGIVLLNESAREIVFCDQAGAPVDLSEAIGCRAVSFYILPEETVRFTASLSHVMESDNMLLLGATQSWTAYDILDAELADAVLAEGQAYGNLILLDYETQDIHDLVYLFPSEAAADGFRSLLADAGLDYTYRYADEAGKAADGGVARYTVFFADQNGDPVPGCIVNFCTDDACVPVIADENGVAAFEGEPYPYHLQVIRVPEGYEFDTAQEFTAGEAGGELTFTVNKK